MIRLRRKRARRPHRTRVTRWCVRFAEDLTVLAQELMRLDQRIVAPGQRWREYNLCVAVRLAIVPFFYDEPDPAQHAKAVESSGRTRAFPLNTSILCSPSSPMPTNSISALRACGSGRRS